MWKLEQEEKNRIAMLKTVMEHLSQEAVERRARLLEDDVVFAAFWAYCYFILLAMVGMVAAHLLANPISTSLPEMVGELVFRGAIAGACLAFAGNAFGHRWARSIVASYP